VVDEGAGLTRLGARSYDADLGSFISPDPVIDHSDSQQMHAFSYANNSPVSFTDPDGLFLRRTFARARAWAAQRARQAAIRAYQAQQAAIRAWRIRMAAIRAARIRAAQNRAARIRAAQIRAAKIRAAQRRAAAMRAAAIRKAAAQKAARERAARAAAERKKEAARQRARAKAAVASSQEKQRNSVTRSRNQERAGEGVQHRRISSDVGQPVRREPTDEPSGIDPRADNNVRTDCIIASGIAGGRCLAVSPWRSLLRIRL
jgi:RHS repeat-associated protein